MIEQPKVQGKIMPYETVSESWQEYNLADGNTLLLKNVLLTVLKTDQVAPDGVPVYNVKCHLIVNCYSKEQGYVQQKR